MVRQKETALQRKRRLEKEARKRQEKREQETDEARAIRREKDRLRKQKKQLNKTLENTSSRLATDREPFTTMVANETMLAAFRVSEFHQLLGFAGRSKAGRKTELQKRALDLLKIRSPPILVKITELYKKIHVRTICLFKRRVGEDSIF
uniref:Actin cytoskeleton-regulatory complex protein pan1-like n=1 Tax=Diabrotica virgifera virgifera TaxID=50390 RepID=A0A6P7G878_DIAVI